MTRPRSRMRRLLQAAAAIPLAIGIALAADTWSSFDSRTTAVAKGGAVCVSETFAATMSVGEACMGETKGGSYTTRLGSLAGLGMEEEWITAVKIPAPPPTPEAPDRSPFPWFVGKEGKADLHWGCSKSGTATVLVEGTTVRSGVVNAGMQVTEIYGSELANENAWNDVEVRMEAGGETRSLHFAIYSDATPPVLESVEITRLTCAVDSDRASDQAKVYATPKGGTPVAHAVSGGTADLDLDGNARSATLSVVNRFGRNVEWKVDLDGDEASPEPAGSVVGRTVFWTPGYDPGLEVEITIDGERDTKPTNPTKGNIELDGAILVRDAWNDAEYEFSLLSAKGKRTGTLKKKVKPGRGRKITLKAKSKYSKKVSLKLEGYLDGDRIVVSRLKLKTPKHTVKHPKHGGFEFVVGEDAGDPLRILKVVVSGQVSDVRTFSATRHEPSFVHGVADGVEFDGLSPVPLTMELSEGDDYEVLVETRDDAQDYGNRKDFRVRAAVARD